MSIYARLVSDPLTPPVYAIKGTLGLVGLWKHYMKFRSIQVDGCATDTCFLHDAVHRSEILWAFPHPMNENEQVDIVVGHGNGEGNLMVGEEGL
jgi:hypothetical protein